MLRADVSPSFTQHHSDVADMAQTQACALHPEGLAARGCWEAGNPRPLVIGAGQMRHQVFDRLALDSFPCPCNREDKAPTPGRIMGITVQHHPHVLLGAIRGIACDDDPRGPGGWDEIVHHRTKQGIFRLVRRMAFGPNEAKGHRQAIDVPVGDQQRKAHPEKPGLMLAFSAFLPQRILCAPFWLVTAITHKIEGTVFRWWQGVQGFLHPPLHEQMDIPIACFQQAAEAPYGDRGRGPTSEFFQGFAPWKEGLHENQPAQNEAMPTFPDTRHPAKQDRDEQGQIGDRDHSMQRQERVVGDKKSRIPVVSQCAFRCTPHVLRRSAQSRRL